MPPEIRGLIFDLDGVITDTAEYHFLAWKRLTEEEGIPFTREDNEALRGLSRSESLKTILKGRPIDDSTAQNWMDRKNAYYLEYLQELTPANLLPGVPQLLEDARARGLKLGLGSASKNARLVMSRLGMESVFDVIGDGYCVVNAKPAPDLFLWVAGALRVYPTQAIVFEDAEAGINAARAGGFFTVGLGNAATNQPTIWLPSLEGASLGDIFDRLPSV
jgi:beta-phosphoglucomutase